MGGYVAAVALRAAGAATSQPEPGRVQLPLPRRRPLRAGRHRGDRGEGGRAAPARTACRSPRTASRSSRRWCGAPPTTRASSTTRPPPPDVPGPDELKSIQELVPDDAPPPFPFWRNFDAKPIHFEQPWPPEGPRPATWQEWLRFLPTATFDDPWADAARSRDPRRPAELAVRAPPPRLAAAAVHGAHPRPERRVPPAHRPTSRGSSATAPRRCRRAGSSAGRHASGRRAASSTRPAAASASTARCAASVLVRGGLTKRNRG